MPHDPAKAVETLERFAFEGPLSPFWVVLLGLVLAVLFTTTLWFERRLTRKSLVPVFWCLRAVVLAIAIWMLLEPTRIKIERRSTPKSIAIVADVSDSMQAVDPPDEQEDVRWRAAGGWQEHNSLIALGDRTVAAMAAARGEFQQAVAILERGGRTPLLAAALDATRRALERAAANYQAMPRLLGQSPGDLRPQIEALSRALTDSLLPAVEALAARTAHPSALTPVAAPAADVGSVASELESVARRARGIAGALAARPAEAPRPSGDSSLKTKSRLDKVAALLEFAEGSWIRQLEPQVRVRRYAFDNVATALAGTTWGDVFSGRGSQSDAADRAARSSTNLSALLERIGRDAGGEMIETVIVLTDGRHNDPLGRDPREAAASLGKLPIYFVPIGSSKALRDVILHHVNAPQAVAKNDSIVIDAIVSTYDCQGEELEVELSTPEGVVERQRLAPTSDRSDHRVSFTTPAAELGRHDYVLKVRPVTEEATNDNNSESFTVDVVDDEITVLLADNLPRWEFRYLSNLFLRDEHIKCDQLIFNPQLAASGNLQAQLDFPTDVDGWSRYRVIILGDLVPTQLSEASQRSLKQYLTQRGGALILIAGREGMPQAFAGSPLAELLPVEQTGAAPDAAQGYALLPTPEGQSSVAVQVAGDFAASERVWRDVYHSLPVYDLSEYCQPKRTSHSLIGAVPRTQAGTASDRSFLCWQTVGRGRVVFLAAPVSYQLRLRSGDRYHHAFWGQLVRWSIAPDLAPGSKTVRISTDKKRYDFNEPVAVTMQLFTAAGEPVRNAQVRAAAQREDRTVGSVDLTEDETIPGRYHGRFEHLEPGQVQIQAVGQAVADLLAEEKFTAAVTAPVVIAPLLLGEMRDTRSNRPLLEQIAELTGGQVIAPTVVDEVVRWAPLSPHIDETTSRRPLWDSWLCLCLICGCLIAEWIIRKRVGLA